MSEPGERLTDKEVATLAEDPDPLIDRRGGTPLIRILAAEVRTSREALMFAGEAIESVILDEQTIAAGLWRGERLPRVLRTIEAALGR